MKRLRVSSGQSLLLLAFMILVLIAFAGLSIDTAKAFSKQRQIQAAANSGALAGMNEVLLNSSDGEVLSTIQATMTQNGVTTFERVNVGNGWGTAPDTVYYTAEYLNANGEYLGDIGTAPASVPADRGAAHVRITTSVDVQNTFAKVVGVSTFGVGANGAAGTGPCVNGVFPIVVDKIFLQDNLPYWYKPIPLANPYADASAIPAQQAASGGTPSPRFRVQRSWRSAPSGGFYWVRWNGDESTGSATQLEAAMTGSGNLAAGFSEKNPPPSADAIPYLNNKLEVNDWIAGDTGNVASLAPVLNWHITNKTLMILPVTDLPASGNGNNASYHVERFVKVRLLSYSFNGANGYFEFALVQDRAFCSTPETPPPDVPPTTNPFKISLQEKLQFYVPPSGTSSWDVAVVLDFSRSMNWCWATDRDCSPQRQDRRIDIAARVIRSFVTEMLTTRNTAGQDNHLALVTFGHEQGGKYISKLRVPFSSNIAQMKQGFADLLGTEAQPKVINQATELTGYTPIGSGAKQAVQLLANPRTVDAHGNPVKLGVMILTDGLTNVFADSNKEGYANTESMRSDNGWACPNVSDEMNDPFYQATCPPASGSRPKPPVKGMVAVADAARAANPGMTFFAVVVGAQFGLTPIDMQLNLVAPDHYYMANSPEDLQGLVDAIETELADPCQPQTDPLRAAAGAQVTIAHQEGGTVGTFTTNTDGAIVTNLAEGTYVISARHNNVVSPNDPLHIARNYTKLVTQASSSPASSITVVMPATPYTAPGATLTIDNPANAACPN